jgi:hypothetical protein
MTPEQILQQLKISGLCEKVDNFVFLIQELQKYFKEKHGKYFGASELVKVDNINDISKEFDGKIDKTFFDMFELKENKLFLKNGTIDELLENARIEFHEHRNNKGDDGFTIYFRFEIGDIRFVMSKGYGFGSNNIELSIIESDII